MKGLFLCFLIACSATIHFADALSIVPCQQCLANPCLTVKKPCKPGYSLKPNNCLCTCDCVKDPPKPPICSACRCRNCGINGICTVDKKRCLEACDVRCNKPMLYCKRDPCSFNNKCNKNQICVAKCGSCLETKCLAASAPKNPCLEKMCGLGEKCVVDGCGAKCEPVQCPANPCAATTCLVGSKCVNKGCKSECVPINPPCKSSCSIKTCSTKKCLPGFEPRLNTCSCTCECKPCIVCFAILCTPGRCAANEQCVQASCGCSFKCIPKPCSKICPKILRPVCGSDGVTYENECFLNYAKCQSNGKVVKKHDGQCCPVDKCKTIKCGFGGRCVQDTKTCKAKCQCPQACILLFSPVCGSDGKTYSNACFLGVASCESQGKIKFVKKGPCMPKCNKCNIACQFGALCIQDPKTCKNRCECPLAKCANINKPVCGTDRVTYPNQCTLDQVICRTQGKVRKASNGKCPCQNKCPLKNCGLNRRCVWNQKTCTAECPCRLTCANILCIVGSRCVHDSKKCTTKCVCSNDCPKTNKPVCGTNGITYKNLCKLSYAICKNAMNNGPPFTKKNDGKCKKDCIFHNPCSGIRCGATKRCVPNFNGCSYSCQPKVCPNQQCVQPACDAKPCPADQKCINICPGSCVHACEIKRTCDIPCTKIYKPVCGTDGKTYSNQCLLNIARCKSQGKIRRYHTGPCHINCKASCATTKCPYGGRCFINKRACKTKCVCARKCTKERKPVCGTNGQTYQNRCHYEVARCKSKGKIELKHDGVCNKCSITCASIRCGFRSRCVDDFKNCKSGCVCERGCPRIFRPVCGTDGKTYSNQCILDIAFCKSKGKISKKSDGECPKVCNKDLCKSSKCNTKIFEFCQVNKATCTARCVCPSICTEEFQPVCGSDGVTYGNACKLRIKTCTSGGRVVKKFLGKCEDGKEGSH